jgi:hypothetical protein
MAASKRVVDSGNAFVREVRHQDEARCIYCDGADNASPARHSARGRAWTEKR